MKQKKSIKEKDIVMALRMILVNLKEVMGVVKYVLQEWKNNNGKKKEKNP